MKKFIYVILIVILFTGCSSKTNEVKNDKLKEINDEIRKENIENKKSLEEEIKGTTIIEENYSFDENVEVKVSNESKGNNNKTKNETNEKINTPTISNEQKNKEEKSETPIWEEFGMTKEQYENTPMGSWRKVTHSSFNECDKAGNNLLDDETNEYTTFWCYEVISYSGKTLGYMLVPEE